MALRLGDYAIRGEIRNTNRNSVCGYIEVLEQSDGDGESGGSSESRRPAALYLSLTGNLEGNLEGKAFRFLVREEDRPNPPAAFEPDAGIGWQQIGAMGQSSYRMVRIPLVPVEELYQARRRGEEPPEERKPSLYLEWYSQNGRVVLELINPVLEFEGEYSALADPEPDPVPFHDESGLPQILMLQQTDDGDFEETDISAEIAAEDAAEDDADEFDLFPEGLEDQIRSSACGTDDFCPDTDEAGAGEFEDDAAKSPTLRDWEDVIPGIDPETKAMYEQWDEVLHGTKDEPLTWLFEAPLYLPRPADVVDEEHAWVVLRSLLTAMARRGVAFDMCCHFTAMQAYRLLVDELLPDAGVHPNLVASGFIRHYSSWESCPECVAELEAECRANHPDE